MISNSNRLVGRREKPIRSTASVSLGLAAFIGVLPNDYLLHIVYKGKEKWTGVAWVFMYDSTFTQFLGYGVTGFKVDYYNVECVIEIDRV